MSSGAITHNPKPLLAKHYGFKDPVIEKLPGYDNLNYKITDVQHRFVLKSFPETEQLAGFLEAHNEVLETLSQTDQQAYPAPVRNKDGGSLTIIEAGSGRLIYVLLTYVEGSFLGDHELTEELLRSLGNFLARMNRQLLSLYQPAIAARELHWDLRHFGRNEIYLDYITDPEDKKLVAYFLNQFRDQGWPKLRSCRKCLIQNDANEWNILVRDEKVSGIIDFGDMVYSQLINELAIALAYTIAGQSEPLSKACTVIKAYHEILPLREEEVDLLYDLIPARLSMSIANAAYNRVRQPDNSYIGISQEPVRSLLKQWISINPVEARMKFRQAIDRPVPEPPTMETHLKNRQKYLSPALSISYQRPIAMEKAAFQYMYDAYGHTFLDAYNNIIHVGHCHPTVVRAGQLQLNRLNTNTRYLYEALEQYAEQLLSKFPERLNKVFFVNSGSAASDLAIRLAKTYTGHRHIAVMKHGYHGHTETGISISAYKYKSKGGPGKAPHIIELPLPDTYKGDYRQNDDAAGKAYAQAASDLLDQTDHFAAFIAEPIVGCGGQAPLAKGYLSALYPVIRAKGGICISDEVQAGFGRLGEYFWGYEMHDVVPDIVILGKPMGNGHPMAAVITTDEIAAAFDNGMEFFSSFGGNPVSCAIGTAVLEVIETENLDQQAKDVGEYLKDLMGQINNKHIGDIRGKGLFLGVEMIRDKPTAPDTALAQLVKNKMREHHILIGTDGPADNVLKIKPPLCFNRSNATRLAETLNTILDKASVR